MHPPNQPSSIKSGIVDGGGHPSSTLTRGSPSPFGKVDLAQSSPALNSGVTTKPWQPRQQSRRLFKGANGTWYLRLTVPAAVRARYPKLPKELKRSTETADRRQAEARAREMRIFFDQVHNWGSHANT